MHVSDKNIELPARNQIQTILPKQAALSNVPDKISPPASLMPEH